MMKKKCRLTRRLILSKLQYDFKFKKFIFAYLIETTLSKIDQNRSNSFRLK